MLANLWERLMRTWGGPGGGGEVWRVAYPLILSHMSLTVQIFVDRVFLTWYSPEGVAGAVTGGFFAYVPIMLFTSTGEYLTTFVAQYFGAGRPRRIGPAMWQGFYFVLLAAAVIAALQPLAGPLFRTAGHPPAVLEAELAYSQTLMLGAFFPVLMATLASFFSGRGITLVVLVVNIAATLVNVVLDYGFIFGKLGLPELGVRGAALATIASQAVGASIFAALILSRGNRTAFATASGFRPELPLLGRLFRYGVPAGLQVSLEVLAFSLFMLIVGTIDTVSLAATSIAFSLNAIVFFPMLGLGLGVSALVGRYQGASQSAIAERVAYSALTMSLIYMTACGAVYIFAPDVLLGPFAAGADPAAFEGIAGVARILLRFVAIYSIFDMFNVIFAAALKGAGDTAYPLVLTVTLGTFAMLLPALVLCRYLGYGVYAAWMAASAYVVLIGLLMIRRFRGGRWRSMRVIEHGPPELERAVAAGETA